MPQLIFCKVHIPFSDTKIKLLYILRRLRKITISINAGLLTYTSSTRNQPSHGKTTVTDFRHEIADSVNTAAVPFGIYTRFSVRRTQPYAAIGTLCEPIYLCLISVCNIINRKSVFVNGVCHIFFYIILTEKRIRRSMSECVLSLCFMN